MQLLLCLTLGLFHLFNVEAKPIQILIDPDDVLKIVDGLMNSDTFQKFSSQLIKRDLSSRMGYDNPYHPEDELVNNFDATVDLEKKKTEKLVSNSSPQRFKLAAEFAADPIDKENEDFALGGQFISGDDLTDNELTFEKRVAIKANDSTTTTTDLIDRKFDTIVDPKPISSRKGAKPGLHRESKKGTKHLSYETDRVSRKDAKQIHVFDYEKVPSKVDKKLFINFNENSKDVKHVNEDDSSLNVKDVRQVYEDDRANFKPVQTRFVQKKSN